MNKVGIIGVGEYLPQKILTNADLEKMVETSDEWITTRTGIKERHLAADNEATSDMCLAAARKALEQAKLKPEDLELLIVCTITPDMQFPATASIVQAKLGAMKAAPFDISAACAGFIYGLTVAQQFIANGTYKNALVIGAEKLSAITDWNDRNTCVLFGDGAGAAVLAPVKEGGILSTYLGCDGTKTELLNMPGGGSRLPFSQAVLDQRLHYIRMQGNEVFKIAVNSMADAAQEALGRAGLKCADVRWIIPHQANIRIINAVAKRLGFVNAEVYLNIERCGNMSAASTATAFVEAAPQFKKGDIILLVAFGAGLVWAAAILQW